jgi:hypothetical protein
VDTWTVSVLGGDATRRLPNAAGVVWLDRQDVLFSEFKNGRGHLGIVTATDARTEELDGARARCGSRRMGSADLRDNNLGVRLSVEAYG